MKRISIIFGASLIVFFATLGILKAVKDGNKKIASTTVIQALSVDELKKETGLLQKIVQDNNPRSALNFLRNETKSNGAILRSCHELAHEIGHSAYLKYGSFGDAMKYQDEICNSGYMHGVIESHFVGSKDMIGTMKSICTGYESGKFLSWECYHGIGHGLMFFTQNNLPESLAACDSYKDSFAQSSCINGVFMENFNSDQILHPSLFLDGSDLFFPCGHANEKNKSDCYLYAPIHYLNIYKNDYIGALKWCESAEARYRSSCAEGVGSQTMKENIDSPAFVEEICNSGRWSQIVPCVRGMTGLYINHFGSLSPAADMCKKLNNEDEKTCDSIVRLSGPLFE